MNTTRFQKLPALRAAVLAGAMLSGLALSGCSEEEGPSGPAGDPNAKINVSSPAAGDTYKVGDSLRIRWTVKEDAVDPFTGVNVSLSVDGGVSWGSLLSRAIDPGQPDWGNFAWKIKDSLYIQTRDTSLALAGKTNCLVKVEEYRSSSDLLKKDTSGVFTITP